KVASLGVAELAQAGAKWLDERREARRRLRSHKANVWNLAGTSCRHAPRQGRGGESRTDQRPSFHCLRPFIRQGTLSQPPPRFRNPEKKNKRRCFTWNVPMRAWLGPLVALDKPCARRGQLSSHKQ